MRYVLALMTIFLIAGCDKPPVSTGQTNNPEVPVALLFEHDGCRVYRFIDGGRTLYYVRCKNGMSQQTMGEEYCGKGCKNPVGIQTVVELAP